MINDDTPAEPTGPVTDDRLRLVFTCCHPALAPENRIALTLRLLGGLTVAEIAHAFLVPETTMAQRITRAKAKIKQARIPYRVPRATISPHGCRPFWPSVPDLQRGLPVHFSGAGPRGALHRGDPADTAATGDRRSWAAAGGARAARADAPAGCPASRARA